MTVRPVTAAAVSSITTTPAASEDQPPCMQPIIHFKEMLIQQARLPHSTLDTTTETWQELIIRAAATHQQHWADSPEHLQPSIITRVQHWGEHPDTGAETLQTTTLLRSILVTPVRPNSTFLRDMEEKSRELNHLCKNFSILVIKKYLNHLLKNKVFIRIIIVFMIEWQGTICYYGVFPGWLIAMINFHCWSFFGQCGYIFQLWWPFMVWKYLDSFLPNKITLLTLELSNSIIKYLPNYADLAPLNTHLATMLVAWHEDIIT